MAAIDGLEQPVAPVQAQAAGLGVLGAGVVRKIMLAALVAVLFWVALAFYSDVQEVRRTVHTFRPGAFVTALLLAAGNFVLRILRWDFYLRRVGIRIRPLESALVFLSGMVMSVTPGKIGEVFKSLLLYESHRTPIERTIPVVIAERVTDVIALGLLIAAGSLAVQHGFAVTLASGAFVAILLILCAYAPLGYWSLRLLDRSSTLRRITPRLHEAYAALVTITRPLPLFLGCVIGFLAWGLQCASLYAIARGFPGVQLGLEAATFAYSAPTLAGAFAMIPGGLGITEFGMTVLLQSLGGPAMTAAVTAATTVLVRIATLWFAVVLGLLAMTIYRATKRKHVAARDM